MGSILVSQTKPSASDDRSAQKMVRYIIFIGFSIMLVACDSEITSTATHHSNDGKLQIQFVEELQGANDPSPWWTHVSLTKGKDDLRQFPGNLLKLEGRGSIAVDWNGNSEVSVYLEDPLFSQISSLTVMKHNTPITFRKMGSRTTNHHGQSLP